MAQVNLTDAEIKHEIFRAVDKWEQTISDEFGARVNPEISFDIRGRTTGGQALLSSGKIRFNLDWARVNLDEYLNDTVPHELAHLVAYRNFQDTGHGRYWKYVMRRMGCEPKRTTSAFSNAKRARKVKRHIYITSCSCEPFEIATSTHNKIQQGRSRVCSVHRHPIVADDYYETITLE